MTRDNIVGTLHSDSRLSGGLSVGGGTTDYNELENKPSINGIELVGNIMSDGLGIWQPKNFSTEEQNTGVKWIDDKYIYVITIDNINNNNWYDVSMLNIYELINARYFFETSNDYYFGNIYASSTYLAYFQYDNNLKRVLYTINGWFVSKRVITMFYTKN